MLYKEMEDEGRAVLAKEGIPEKKRELVRTMNVQYFGQFRGIEVTWPSGPITKKSIAEGVKNFHKEHKARYGHSDENYPYMFTSWGLSAIGKITPVSVSAVKKGSVDASKAVKGKRQAYFDEKFTETIIYDGDKVKAGNVMKGPCIIEERMTNIVIPPRSTAKVDNYGNYIVTDK
jgi:N-methylhydantoinase A